MDGTSNNMSVLLGDGNGSFGAATNFAVGFQPQEAVIADLNLDGKNDVAVAAENSNFIAVFLGDGTGAFGAPATFAPGTGASPGAITVGDFNHDGKPDLATANFDSNDVSILLGDGSGGFTATNFPAGDGNEAIAAGDFNGDGETDLVTGNLNVSDATVLLNGCASATAATFTVNSANDIDDGTCNAAHCSLREAINAANANAGFTDTITFNIPGSGVQTITPASTLPVITEAVTIDGYTQPGASANTLAVGNNAVLLIEIAGGVTDGVTLGASGSTVRGLLINNTGGFGIRDQSAGGNTFNGNWIGINAAGTTLINVNGVFINSSNNTVGGTSAADRNVITGSGSNGAIVVFGGTGNVIQGNYIGTNATGSAGLGSGGIVLSNNTTVGGAAPGAGNVISGSRDISMFSKTGCVVQGNFVGTSADGNTLLGNAFGGIFINTAQDNTIGGNVAAARNVVATSIIVNGVSGGGGGNTIQGNFIGTNAAGNAAVGALASSSGIAISGSNNIVGGAAAGAGNVIANHSTGIAITGPNNTVQGNFVGTNAAGTAAIANSTGISISGGASVAGNLVGGNVTAARNVISGNSGTGVSLGAGVQGANTVQGNFIGAGSDGGALGNGGDGIRIVATNGQIIGGIGAGEGNVIANNAADGVSVILGTGHAIRGNSIFSNGTTALTSA